MVGCNSSWLPLYVSKDLIGLNLHQWFTIILNRRFNYGYGLRTFVAPIKKQKLHIVNLRTICINLCIYIVVRFILTNDECMSGYVPDHQDRFRLLFCMWFWVKLLFLLSFWAWRNVTLLLFINIVTFERFIWTFQSK